MHLELVASSAEEHDVYGGKSIAQLEEWKETYWDPDKRPAHESRSSPGLTRPSRMQICDWKYVTVLLACNCRLDLAPDPEVASPRLASSPSEDLSLAGPGSGGLLGYLFRTQSAVGAVK